MAAASPGGLILHMLEQPVGPLGDRGGAVPPRAASAAADLAASYARASGRD